MKAYRSNRGATFSTPLTAGYSTPRGKARGRKVTFDVCASAPARGAANCLNGALALRDWFRDHNLVIHRFNVLTEDCHARRTQLLFQEAFGKKFTVGVIPVSNPDFNPKDWWRYSDGVREVIGESIAYIYARFLFYPSPSAPAKNMAQTSPGFL